LGLTPILFPVSLFPIRGWSENPSNRCSYNDILSLWESYEVITFLADIQNFEPSFPSVLSKSEEKRKRSFKTDYFRKRFTASRNIIRHILQPLVNAATPRDVILRVGDNGRVVIDNSSDIWISLSYTNTKIAITVGKQKIGNDIEIARLRDLNKTRICSIFGERGCTPEKGIEYEFLMQWTMMEAYAKLRDMNLYPMTKERFNLQNAHFISYKINQDTILSLASDSHLPNDILLWINPVCEKPRSACRGNHYQPE
jgi:hypothetical protein